MTVPSPRALWIGTYPVEGRPAGSGEGVWQVEVAADGTFGVPRLAAVTPAPSFVALHPSGRTLYAVAEQGEGTVSAFPVLDDGALGAPVTIGSGGDSPCHLLALDDVLWIANYMDGVAAYVAVNPESGELADEAVSWTSAPQGSGPVVDRQEGSHAHFCAAVGDGVLIADLGVDALRRSPARPWLPREEPLSEFAALLAPGTGPRHLVALPGGSLVVVGELDVRLHLLAPVAADVDPRARTSAPTDPSRTRVVVDGWAPSSSVPASLAPALEGALPSHVTLTDDLLLVGVRGADVLAVHRVATGRDGSDVVEPLADVDLGKGAWPRHHEVVGTAQDGRLLVVVARQGAGDLAAVLLDPVTGKGEVVDAVSFPTPPSCVVVSDAAG